MLNNVSFDYLRLPLFVAYLMWLQRASNISLAVVTERESKTWKMRSKRKIIFCKIIFDAF